MLFLNELAIFPTKIRQIFSKKGLREFENGSGVLFVAHKMQLEARRLHIGDFSVFDLIEGDFMRGME
jgi:hypothetical protein